MKYIIFIFVFLQLAFCLGGKAHGVSRPNTETHVFASATDYAPIPWDIFDGAVGDISIRFAELLPAVISKERKSGSKKHKAALDLLKKEEFADCLKRMKEIEFADKDFQAIIAYVAFRSGMYAEASKHAKSAVKENCSIKYKGRDVSEGIYLLSQLKLGSYTLCNTFLEYHIRQRKEKEQYHLYRAIYFTKIHDLQKAVFSARSHVASYPGDDKAKLFASVLEKRMLLLVGAFDYEKVLQDELKWPGYFLDMALNVRTHGVGRAYYDKFLEKNIKVEPANMEPRIIRCNDNVFSSRDYVSAKNDIEKIKIDENTLPWIFVLNGLILKGLGKHNEALSAFEEALKRNPFEVEAIERIGNMYLEHGKYKDCLPYVAQLIDIEPWRWKRHTDQSKLFLILQDFPAAKKALQNAKKVAMQENGDIRELRLFDIVLNEIELGELRHKREEENERKNRSPK
jgi:tetratricopeptide (TPR) repeat protein